MENFYRVNILQSLFTRQSALTWSNEIADASWWSHRGIRICRINAHCVCIDLVGRVITIRSAYKGMHQGGNKSSVHGESICFHLHGRIARMGRWEGETDARRERTRERRRRGWWTESFRAKGPRNSASYLWNGYWNPTDGPPHSQNMFVRTTILPSRKTATPRDQSGSALSLFFLGEITRNAPDEQLKDFTGDSTLRYEAVPFAPLAFNRYFPDLRIRRLTSCVYFLSCLAIRECWFKICATKCFIFFY